MTPYRQLWWLAVLLVTSTVSADESHCPCVPPGECSQTADTYTTCEDPTTVRCCDEAPPPSLSEPLQMASRDLEQEEKFMEAINHLMEKMQHIATPVGENREDRSLDGTSKNTLNCDGKQCEQKLGSSTKDETIHQPSVVNLEPSSDKLEDLSEHQSLESAKSNSTREEPDAGEARNKLVIVYAENQNKNITLEEKTPHIVYPSKEAMEEYLQSEETSIMAQQLAAEENGQRSETEDEQDSEAFRNQQSAYGKPNLHKLFPKRNPPLKSSHSQTEPDDQGEEGSEIEEVKTSVPTTVQIEQSQNRKQLRPLTRHVSHRPVMTDESTQTGSAFESQTGTRGRIGIPTSTHIDIAKNLQHQDSTAAIMEEINLKALNDMMKTNFTGRLTLLRKQRPMWHPQSRLHSTIGTSTSLPSGRTYQELKNLPQSTNPQTGGTPTLSEQAQRKTPENSESVEHVTNTTATEVKGSRYVTRRRNQFRNQNVNLPSKFSTAVSMSQEHVFDTSKESKPQGDSRRRPSYRRSQVKAQSGTPNADLAEKINAQSDPSYGKRRTKFRPRSKAENMTPAGKNSYSDLTNSRTAQNPGSTIDNPTPSGLKQNAGRAAPTTHNQVPQLSDVKFEGDLESSGSDVDPRRVRVRGRFSPPQRMEKGFQPMFGPAELNVIGPVPAGFQDRARGFSNEELGFELPRANLRSQFTEDDQFQFDAEGETENPLRLLPPVFPVSRPPTSTRERSNPPLSSPDTFSDADLLPPLETPKPLSASLEKVMPKVAEKLMLDQHRDITELNQEFNQLKTRYDMLLNRYAETLKVYNDKYRNLFGSNENNK